MDGFLSIDSQFVKEVLVPRYRLWNIGQTCNISHAPPLSCQWFDSILGRVILELRDRFFGYSYHVVTERKTLNRDTSNKSLIELLCEFERYCEGGKNRFVEITDTYEFFRLVLEENAPLLGFEEDLFGPIGIKRDRSKLSEPQKNTIATQAAAQGLWYLRKNEIPTIASMRQRLLDKGGPFYEHFGLSRFQDSGTIEDWIGEVYSVPKNSRQGL